MSRPFKGIVRLEKRGGGIKNGTNQTFITLHTVALFTAKNVFPHLGLKIGGVYFEGALATKKLVPRLKFAIQTMHLQCMPHAASEDATNDPVKSHLSSARSFHMH